MEMTRTTQESSAINDSQIGLKCCAVLECISFSGGQGSGAAGSR